MSHNNVSLWFFAFFECAIFFYFVCVLIFNRLILLPYSLSLLCLFFKNQGFLGSFYHFHTTGVKSKQRTSFLQPLIWCVLFSAHSSATAKMWAISIDSSPRKRRIWRPPTKSLWWIWIRTSLQDSPFSIQSLCSMSEKNDYFGPSCILLHTHNYPRAFSHDFQKIIDIPFTISAIAEIIRIWSSVFFFLIFPEPKTKCFVNKTVMLSMLLYQSPLLIFIYPSFGCCLQ